MVSVDLTGGTDSRVIVGVQFETAVSGTAAYSDVLISKRVAASLGNSHPHHPVYTVLDLNESGKSFTR